MARRGVIEDLTGRRYGRWTVLRLARRKPAKRGTVIYWLCRCECGGLAEVQAANLRSGTSTRCRGCADRAQTGMRRS